MFVFAFKIGITFNKRNAESQTSRFILSAIVNSMINVFNKKSQISGKSSVESNTPNDHANQGIAFYILNMPVHSK
jgi:hypothetical protein